jgi:aminoglycoside 6-adenylyltransferase
MVELILGVAEGDTRVRAVVLSGSRANPAAWRDAFQDFDITYLVTDVESFVADEGWIRPFGELMILQTPEAMGDPAPAGDGRFAYLMQFTDGNRIDLTLCPADRFVPESLAVVMLDKDGVLGELPPPSERDHLGSPPTTKLFADCCNEFWWVAPYVAKGLGRGEIIYAKHHLDVVMRGELMKMLGWYLGVEAGFDHPVGKHGKELRRVLSHELWGMVERTYAGAEEEENWEALFVMGELFRRAAGRVAGALGFAYPAGDDARVTAHLRRVWVGDFGGMEG